MSRQSRVVAVGVPYHITQRGNNRQTVFRSDADRLFYLDTLRRKSREHGLSILGYCLMSNHVHLVATPRQETSLARAIGQTHFIYAQRFNRTRGRGGTSGRAVSTPRHSAPTASMKHCSTSTSIPYERASSLTLPTMRGRPRTRTSPSATPAHSSLPGSGLSWTAAPTGGSDSNWRATVGGPGETCAARCERALRTVQKRSSISWRPNTVAAFECPSPVRNLADRVFRRWLADGRG